MQRLDIYQKNKDMKIALISCTNGLGHVARLSMLAKAMSKYGCEIDFYAPKIKFKKFF